MFFTKDLDSSPCGYFFRGQIFYVTVSLPSWPPERNIALLVLFLPSGTVLGADQCNCSSSVHRSAQTQTHPRCLLFILSFPWCHWKDRCMRRWPWPSDVTTLLFPLFRSFCCLHSWASKACVVTLKEKLTANTSKRETESFWFDLSDTKPLVWCINCYFIFIIVQWGIQA